MTLGRFFRSACEEGSRLLFKAYFRLVHRLSVEGRENIPRDGGRLIVLANHASLIDGVLLWTYIPMDLSIIVDRRRARELLLRPFMRNWRTIEIDPMNPYSLKGVIERVSAGTAILVFPEGRMTRTGSLMKVYEGTGFVAYKTGARILPVYLKNTYQTVFSRKKGRKRLFAPVSLTIMPPVGPLSLDALPPRKRKKEAARVIYRTLCDAYVASHNKPSTLGREFVGASGRNGGRPLYKDTTGTAVSYRKALAAAFILGAAVGRGGERHVGLLLPNLTVTALIFWGLQLFRKVPVLLNYSLGHGSLSHALDLADLRTVITSRAFLKRIKIPLSLLEGRRAVFIEDLKGGIGRPEKMHGFLRALFPGACAAMRPGEEKETAAILFTSGSEGKPKGVCLSHENILSDIHQAVATFEVSEDDYFLNVLPMFHSFGLTAGTILPVIIGARVFLYVSPLHYRIIPEVAYDEGCTIFMATNTFLRGYSRKAHPYDFHSVRYIFCGAEPLSRDVFDTYAKAFGLRVLEGYGATECSPIVSLNTPMEHRFGTVGRILPGIEHRIVPVAGVDDRGGRAGRLFLRGKSIMKGYLENDEANRKYREEDGGWYDTGDVVELSEDGFLSVLGRLKRFAKVGGEMISLAALEEALQGRLGERQETAVVSLHDALRGERLVVVTTSQGVDAKVVREILKDQGFSDLAIPREIRFLRELPKLGTGKVDYLALREMLGRPE